MTPAPANRMYIVRTTTCISLLCISTQSAECDYRTKSFLVPVKFPQYNHDGVVCARTIYAWLLFDASYDH